MSANAMEDLTSTDKSKPRKHPRSYDATLELTNEDNVGNRVGLTESKVGSPHMAQQAAKYTDTTHRSASHSLPAPRSRYSHLPDFLERSAT